MNELDLFTAALAVPNSAERKAFLDRECAGNIALRERLAKLVEAHLQSHPLLDQQAIVTVDRGTSMLAGAVIAGRYKLLEAIGEGGMGTVWVAEQTEPVRRKVALKLIKAGMDSRSVLARFEAERQALAVMDHPNIAKVLDGGMTETGRPYFVMEYVKGVPITEYCDATRLSVQQRLNLFVQVCQAVQHAHQKGIIHRDLKPSNILVAPYDDLPVPKVIDFGLAKAMHQSLTEKTLHTAHETVLGTPLYMSPEQAQLNNIDVDTRSDIYSLGVLLYELLTGTTPLEKQRFKEAAWDEVKRIIREEEPPRPSMRISSTATLPSLAAGRQIEPTRLTKLVRGELDWIVMKSLEKDRSRRYETANGFAADVQRYLSGEPVLAAPPSARYRMRKFARKHRAGLTVAATLSLLLVTGVAVSTWQAVRATRAEAAARNAEQDALQSQRAEAEQKAKAEQAAAQERASNEQAQARLKQIEKGNAILTSIFDDLNIYKVKEGNEPLESVLAKQLVKAAEQLEGETIGDPLVVAGLQNKLGLSLLKLGYAPEAIPLFQKARETRTSKLGTDDPETLTSMDNLASGYQTVGKLDLALPLFEETLKLRKATLGADHIDTLSSMGGLASGYRAAKKLDLALPLLEETLKLRKATLGADHPDTLKSMNNLAALYLDARKFDLALPLLEEALKLEKVKPGADHPNTLATMGNLAVGYLAARKLDLALPLLEETLKLKKTRLGADHPHTLISRQNLASGYKAAGKLNLALPLYEETLKLQQVKMGADHPDTLKCMSNLALAYLDTRKLDLALPLLEEALKLRKATQGADHPDTLTSMNILASAYWRAKRLDKSIPLFEEAVKLQEAKQGRQHPSTILSVMNLGVNYKDAGRLAEALPLLEEAYRASKQHPLRHSFGPQLLDGYVKADKSQEAATLVAELLTDARTQLPRDSPQLVSNLAQYGRALLQLKAYTEAEPLLRECLAIHEKTQPDVWTTFNTKSMLGGALLGQKKYTEAEPLLLAGYQGIKELEKTIPPEGTARIPEALDRLIELHTATDKPGEVMKWQAERAKYPQSAPQESK